MKGLFSSKKFRKNLRKWLVMYLGVMAFLTTVITYSKYMSSMYAKDSARVAKFNVLIKPNNCTNTDEEQKTCNIGVVRPTKIDYYFTVDTSELEVNTNIYLKIYINDEFKNFYQTDIIKEVKNDTEEEINLVPKENKVTFSGKNYNQYNLNYLYKVGEEDNIRTFHVIVKLISNNEYKEGYSISSPYDIVRVGYSAIQNNTNILEEEK